MATATQTLKIERVEVSNDGKAIKLILPGIKPVDVMTISYSIADQEGKPVKGIIQNTIHNRTPLPGMEIQNKTIN